MPTKSHCTLIIRVKTLDDILSPKNLKYSLNFNKNPASQDKICLNNNFWSSTVIDFHDENNNL